MNESFHWFYSMEVVRCNRGVHTVGASGWTVHDSAGALGWDMYIGVKVRKVLRQDRVITVAQGAQWEVMFGRMRGRAGHSLNFGGENCGQWRAGHSIAGYLLT